MIPPTELHDRVFDGIFSNHYTIDLMKYLDTYESDVYSKQYGRYLQFDQVQYNTTQWRWVERHFQEVAAQWCANTLQFTEQEQDDYFPIFIWAVENWLLGMRCDAEDYCPYGYQDHSWERRYFNTLFFDGVDELHQNINT